MIHYFKTVARHWSQSRGLAAGQASHALAASDSHQLDPHFHLPSQPKFPAISVGYVKQYAAFHVTNDARTTRPTASLRQPQQHTYARIQALGI